MSDAPTIGTPLHGSGGLLGTMGLGASRQRKGRKWGMRLKAKQIKGNLYRGDTGKFQAGSGGGPAGATPKRGFVLSKQPNPTARGAASMAKPKKGGGGGAGKKPKAPKQTPAQRQAAHDAQQAQNRAKVLAGLNIAPDGQAALEALRSGGQPDAAAIARGGFEQAGLVERAADGSYRMTGSGRALMNAANAGDAGRAGDSISSARDRTTSRTDRQQAAADRKKKADAKRAAAAAAAKKPKAGGGGGGGGGGKQAADIARSARAEAADAARTARAAGVAERRRQVEARRAAAAADRQAKQQRVLDRLKRQAKAGIKLTQAQRNQLTDAGLADESSGMWRVKAGDPGDYLVVEDRTKPSTWHLQVKRNGTPDHRLMGAAWAALHGGYRGNTYQGPNKTDALAKLKKMYAAEQMDLPKEKSFMVFKDHAGVPRWVARTTTAYRDRDGEIISEAALDADSQRMMATGQFGPLRYWHIGQPDPASLDAPWGPGVDIGDCDYSVVIGRTRIESGTFRSRAIAEKMARVADRHEMSPGFLYTPEQPDADGVFSAIRTFERSPVPRRHARASNLFTGFAVKEYTMELAEMERRFKAMYQELGLTPEQGLELGQQLLATEKDAHAQQIAFKEAAPAQTIYYGPDNAPGIIADGQWVALKAAAPAMVEGSPEEEAAESPEEEAAEMDAGEGDAGDMGGDYLGDMSWDEFAAKLGALLAPVLKMQDMVKAMGDAHAELKGMYGGVAQKDDARAQEVVAIKSQIAQLAEKLAQIEGDQPAMIMPDEVAAALKSSGPAAPESPEDSDYRAALNDSDPVRAIAARTMPTLYKNTPDGGFAGWTPPPNA